MADTYLRQSPLAHLQLIARAEQASATDRVRLGEAAFTSQFVLRGNADDSDFLAVVEHELGIALPLIPNTVSSGPSDADMLRIIWQGPDEWLVVAEESADIGGILGAIVAGRHAAVSDVGESRTILNLSGSRARDVLAKGCALDLHDRVFTIGQCAQTMLAQAHVILHQTSDAPTYQIYIHRSFAEHLWNWLEDASAEYGMKIEA